LSVACDLVVRFQRSAQVLVMTFPAEDPEVPNSSVRIRPASTLIRSPIVILRSGEVLVDIADWIRVIESVINPAEARGTQQ
jgi:hypothetical protein